MFRWELGPERKYYNDLAARVKTSLRGVVQRFRLSSVDCVLTVVAQCRRYTECGSIGWHCGVTSS